MDSGSAARVTTPLRSLVTRVPSHRDSPGARRSPVTGAATRAYGGPAERPHLPTVVHRHRARRGPALGDASAKARFAVAGRACGLCGQLRAKFSAHGAPARGFTPGHCKLFQWNNWLATPLRTRALRYSALRQDRLHSESWVEIGGCHCYPSGQGEDAGFGWRVQSSFRSRIVVTGSPSSPGPTTSFNVVSSASVAWPSRGTRSSSNRSSALPFGLARIA